MKESSYKLLVKRYFFYTIGTCSLFIGCFILFCFIVDPLQVFHKSWFLPKDMLSDNMRVQAVGIIKYYDFDSIILGSSMLANTSSTEANEKLGGTFFNISMRGADFYERSFPLKKALERNIQKVIYSIDNYYLSSRMGDPSFSTARWVFLYDENPFNDLLCYITIRDIRSMFAKNFGLRKLGLDRPEDWFNSPDSIRFGGLSNWVGVMNKNEAVKNFLINELPATAAQTEKCSLTIEHDLDRERSVKQYLDACLLRYVKDYPQTEFYCVFPPYFRYTYARWLKVERKNFFLHQEVIRYLVEKSEDFPNLHVYGFEDRNFPDDIANYKDTTHYHPRINSLMLDAVRDGKSLKPENVEPYLQTCLEKAWNFDIGAFNAEAQRLIRERDAAQKQD